MNENNAKKKTRTVFMYLLILLVIPLAVLWGFKFGKRYYYAVSLVIIVISMVPFFLHFENRKPQARELVLIAVMCAIAVASRAAFAALPGFKPMSGIIMIAGIAFGAETGFLVGTVSLFVSNFIFGQGPWTPWQMFAYGIAGFLAGLFFRKAFFRKKRLLLALFGGLLIFCLIGPILDTSSVLYLKAMTAEAIGAVYLAGVPINAVHAAATFLTLLLFAKPMLEKLDRVKLKYGMTE